MHTDTDKKYKDKTRFSMVTGRKERQGLSTKCIGEFCPLRGDRQHGDIETMWDGTGLILR